VVADATADAARVAADLLAQAEHGDDSEAILFTDDESVAAAVAGLVDGHANVRVERVPSIDAALGRAEEYAPEHLELHVAGAEALVPRIRNAGSIFVGCSSVVGDYAAGATHVLPTGGLARSTGGLGVEAFLKPVQVVTATAEGARRAAEVIVPLARVEGLPLHAAAA
jgi:histidinol dehydrogenase